MSGSGAALQVLLVEDNELDARTMTKALVANRETTFEVTRTADLASAIEHLGRSNVDCVVLDLSLPDSVGLVSVDVLSEQAPGCPIVVLTGLDDPETALEAVERGAQDYLSKGRVDGETLARSIRYAVARQYGEVALRAANAQLDLLRDRERIARNLHDTVIQQLFATGLGLESTAAAIADPAARRRVQGSVEAIDAAIRQLREAIFGLHAIPEEVALAQTVTDLAHEKADALGFYPIVEIGSLPEDMPVAIRHEAVQVVGEALSNVIKHAEATASRVVVAADGPELLVTVTDNGKGVAHLDLSSLEAEFDPPNDLSDGHGIRNMHARAVSLEGWFHIGPGPGGGTRIEWRVPLPPPET
ncbi:MAG: response regulator [Actinomycetota bacterium]